MTRSDYPTIVTMVATPPPGTDGSTENPFITAALRTLGRKQAAQNRIVKVSSVRDIDLGLCKLLAGRHDRVRLQIVGHALSGGLALGACWIPDAQLQSKAFKFPYYILDTNPTSLGLLSKHAGKLSEVMLVACNIGSAIANGHPINGRTLTYTLSELFACDVLGADDVIGPDEFDDIGWYAPHAQRRRPKGWRWLDGATPVWTESGAEPRSRPRSKVA